MRPTQPTTPRGSGHEETHELSAVGADQPEQAISGPAPEPTLTTIPPDLSIAVDDAGIVLRWDGAAERLVGYAKADMNGCPIARIFVDGDTLVPALLERASLEESASGEGEICTPAGEKVQAGIVVSRVPDSQGVHYFHVGIYVNVADESATASPGGSALQVDRLAFLAEAAGALSDSLDYETTLARLAELAVPRLGDFCVIDLVVGGELRRVATAHVNPAVEDLMRELRQKYSPEAGAPAPVPTAITEMRPVFLAEMTDDVLASAAIDETHLEILKTLAPVSVMIIPLVAHSSVLGAFTFAMSESGRHYGQPDLLLAEEVAHQAAMAIENARLYRSMQMQLRKMEEGERMRADLLEAEIQARASAERAQQRLRVIAEASALLTSSLDYETTLKNVANMLVPDLADWCGVDVTGAGGAPERLVLVHSDPSKVEWANELRHRFPPNPEATSGAVNVLRTGVAEFYPTITDEMLASVARSAEELEIMCQVGFSSAIVVPVIARDRTLGAITLVYAESGRVYSKADLELAEELARRAAMAVDNALLYRQAEHARIEAETANRAKDQFLAVLSHELRTPLSPILISAQAIEGDGDLPEHLRPLLEIVRRNIELEARLIDDLLDLTRITRGKLKLNLEPLNVHATIELAIGVLSAEIEAKGLRLERRLDASEHMVTGDSARLQQVLLNILQNAVKFTPPRGSIRIETANDAPGHIRIDVTDSGVGIEAAALNRIFDAFEQGEKTTLRRFGGLGLGLTISKALVEMHGGTIGAHSAGSNHGATFTVGLNVNSVDGNGVMTKTPDQPAKQDGPLRILLVDDHEDTNMVLKLLLQRKGYQVLTAHDVQSALAVAAANEFDVLVSDIGLPDGSGLELMRALLERYPIKGIALSGFGMEEDIRRSREAGFSDHLVKPVNPQRLQEVIQRVTT